MDEFEGIARLFRPLAGEPEALGLMDDAALLATRPGHELVVTTDAIVEGVHFLVTDPPGGVAQKLLRVNLSDLAAKAASPYGYLLTVAWPEHWGDGERTAFAHGLGQDQRRFGLKLFGGDTVATPGPMMASVTMFGWVEQGRMVKRSGVEPGDVLLVSGTIGDGYLGLKAARGELEGLDGEQLAWLADRYRRPQPRLELSTALARHACAAADVSDGLLADAYAIAQASGGIGVSIGSGEGVPLSMAARAWLDRASDRPKALLALYTGGDDYEVVCAARPDQVDVLIAAAARAGTPLTPIGRFTRSQAGVELLDGYTGPLGWRHG